VERAKRQLPAERATIVVQRFPEGPLHYHPQVPLTRDELAIVAEHFDTLCIPGLLANAEIKPGPGPIGGQHGGATLLRQCQAGQPQQADQPL